MNDPLKTYVNKHRNSFDTLDVPDGMFDKIMSEVHSRKKPSHKNPVKQWTLIVTGVAASIILLFNLAVNINSDRIQAFRDKNLTKQSHNTLNLTTDNKISPAVAPKVISDTNQDPKKTLVTIGRKSIVAESQGSMIPQTQDSGKTVTENHSEAARKLMENQFSASSRLKGIDWLDDQESFDPKMIQLLCVLALADDNTNVRLAALAALEKKRYLGEVADKIDQIFLNQNDPIVQQELIRFYAENGLDSKNDSIHKRIIELSRNSPEMFVKDEAFAAILKY